MPVIFTVKLNAAINNFMLATATKPFKKRTGYRNYDY